MNTFGQLAVQIVLMILFGVLLKKTEIINTQLQKGMTRMMLKAILPVSILHSALEENARPSSENLLLSIVLTCAYYVAGIWLCKAAARKWMQEERRRRLFVNLSVFANVAFIGFPLIQALYGAEAVIYAVISNLCYQMFLVFYAVPAFSGRREFSPRVFFRDPMNLAGFAAVIFFFLPVHVPGALMDTMGRISGMMVPLSMIIVGCQLSDVQPAEMIRSRLVWPVSALRLIIFPMIMLGICRVLRLDLLMSQTMVLMTGLACGSLNSILAEQYECYPHEAAISVVGSTVLMFVSLPVLIVIMEQLRW